MKFVGDKAYTVFGYILLVIFPKQRKLPWHTLRPWPADLSWLGTGCHKHHLPRPDTSQGFPPTQQRHKPWQLMDCSLVSHQLGR